MTSARVRQSFWGRSRFGGGTGALVGSCVGVALVVSGAMATYALTGLEGTRQAVVLVFAFVALPSVFALAWVTLVDRASLRDAAERPEETVEVQWIQQAQSAAFADLLVILGITLVAGVFVDLDLSAHLALTLVLAFAMVDVGLRLLWLKRRDG